MSFLINNCKKNGYKIPQKTWSQFTTQSHAWHIFCAIIRCFALSKNLFQVRENALPIRHDTGSFRNFTDFWFTLLTKKTIVTQKPRATLHHGKNCLLNILFKFLSLTIQKLNEYYCFSVILSFFKAMCEFEIWIIQVKIREVKN